MLPYYFEIVYHIQFKVTKKWDIRCHLLYFILFNNYLPYYYIVVILFFHLFFQWNKIKRKLNSNVDTKVWGETRWKAYHRYSVCSLCKNFWLWNQYWRRYIHILFLSLLSKVSTGLIMLLLFYWYVSLRRNIVSNFLVLFIASKCL